MLLLLFKKKNKKINARSLLHLLFFQFSFKMHTLQCRMYQENNMQKEKVSKQEPKLGVQSICLSMFFFVLNFGRNSQLWLPR